MLNSFQHNLLTLALGPVILKQVQDDEVGVRAALVLPMRGGGPPKVVEGHALQVLRWVSSHEDTKMREHPQVGLSPRRRGEM